MTVNYDVVAVVVARGLSTGDKGLWTPICRMPSFKLNI